MPIPSVRLPLPGARFAAIVLPCVLIAACSSGEDSDANAPAPEPTLTPNPVLTAAPDGSAITPGEWFIEEDGDGARARFGTMSSEPLLSMECDRATRTLTMTRNDVQADEEQAFVLEAGGRQARLDMTPAGGELPMLTAEIERTQPVFQGFSQMGGVIEVTSPDGEVLRMPGAPGIARVIEACS